MASSQIILLVSMCYLFMINDKFYPLILPYASFRIYIHIKCDIFILEIDSRVFQKNNWLGPLDTVYILYVHIKFFKNLDSTNEILVRSIFHYYYPLYPIAPNLLLRIQWYTNCIKQWQSSCPTENVEHRTSNIG